MFKNFENLSSARKILNARDNKARERRKQNKIKEEQKRYMAFEQSEGKIPKELIDTLSDIKKNFEIEKKFYTNSFTIEIVDRKAIKNNSGQFSAFKGKIYLAQDLFKNKQEDWEFILAHELTHLADYCLFPLKKAGPTPSYANMKTLSERSESNSELNDEAASELVVFLIFSGGDIAIAEEEARNSYKERRTAWLESYNKNWNSKVNWSDARKKALEIYSSSLMKKICEIMNWK